MALIVSRDSGYADKLRRYAIIVDGNKVGEIGDGETMEFPIGAGKHSIAAKIDWCKTPALEFTVEEGESPSFHVGSNLRGFDLLLTAWYIFFATDKYLNIEQKIHSSARTIPLGNK